MADGQMSDAGPKYPNQQLKAVSLEAFFPGELSTLSSFGAVQQAFAASFPKLFVPNVRAGEAYALRPYVLRNDAQDRAVNLAVNQISYLATVYPGYASFSADAIPAIQTALEIIKPRTLNRVVFRYENEVGIQRQSDKSLPIDRIFPGVLHPQLNGACRSIDVQYECAFKNGSASGSRGYHARVEERSGNEVLLVTVYCGVENTKSIGDFAAAAQVGHDVAYGLFETLISEEFRKFISGNEEPT